MKIDELFDKIRGDKSKPLVTWADIAWSMLAVIVALIVTNDPIYPFLAFFIGGPLLHLIYVLIPRIVTRIFLPFALAVFWTHSAFAQLNPLNFIIPFESSGNPTAQNPTPGSTASGLLGDVNSTWANSLALCNCGTTAQYPTAASAPPSVQLAANAALFNSQGFGPWTCAGCDPALTAALAADGGSAAFLQPGQLSTDPATYAAADTPAGLQAFLANAGTTGGGPLPDGSTVVGATPGTTATITISCPFAKTYDYFQNTLLGAIGDTTPNILVAAGALVAALIVIMGSFKAWQAFDGNLGFQEFSSFAWKAIMVIVLLGGASQFSFNPLFTQFILQTMPTWIADISGGGADNASGNFCAALFNYWTASNTIVAQTPGDIYHIAQPVAVAFTLAIFMLFLIGTLIALFVPLLLVQGALALVAGPLMPILILGILFRSTISYWQAAIGAIVTLLLATLIIDLFAGLLSGALAQNLQNISMDDGPWTAIYQVGSGVVQVLLLGVMIPVGFSLAKTIGGAGIAINASNPARSIRRGLGI